MSIPAIAKKAQDKATLWIQRGGHEVTRTRKGALGTSDETATVVCLIQALRWDELSALQLDGVNDIGTAMPMRFIFAHDTDIRAGDYIAWSDGANDYIHLLHQTPPTVLGKITVKRNFLGTVS